MRVDEHTITLEGSPVYYRAATKEGDAAAPAQPEPGAPAQSGEPAAPAQAEPGAPTQSGEPAAPIVYLHGIPTSSDDWVPFLERIGGIAPDLPGFGRSGKGGHLDYSLQALARFLDSFLAALGIDHVRLVGHDWGAAVAAVFAGRHPQRVSRLVLINPIPLSRDGPWPPVARLWRRRLVGELVMGSIGRRAFGRSLRNASATREAWTNARVKSAWEQFDQGTQRAILRLHRSLDDAEASPHERALEELTMPLLLIWGERDGWLGADTAREYTARLRDAQLARVPAGGHWPWMDEPHVIEQVAEFLGEG